MENVTKICLTSTNANDTSAIAALCKAAGDGLRMQILKVLQQNAYGVLELCEIFNIQQAAMSHHLKVLAKASLVAKRREGTSIFYRRNDLNANVQLQKLQTSLFRSIDKAQLDEVYTRSFGPRGRGLPVSVEGSPAPYGPCSRGSTRCDRLTRGRVRATPLPSAPRP